MPFFIPALIAAGLTAAGGIAATAIGAKITADASKSKQPEAAAAPPPPPPAADSPAMKAVINQVASDMKDKANQTASAA